MPDKKMKFLIVILLAAIGLIAYSQKPSQNFEEKAALIERQSFLNKTIFSESAATLDYNLVYQRMEWQIDPAIRFIRGKITCFFKSNVSALTTISFDLQDNMRVDSKISE